MSSLTLFLAILLSLRGYSNYSFNYNEENSFNPLGYSSDVSASYHNYIQSHIVSNQITNCSNITILTPGMGGDASHWCKKTKEMENNIEVEYYYIFPGTLPYELCTNVNREGDHNSSLHSTDIKVFLLNDENDSRKLEYLQLFDSQTYKYKVVNSDCIVNHNFSNYTGQLIFIYDGFMGSESYCSTPEVDYTSDAFVFGMFKDCVNRVVAGIAAQQHGYLPKINLIGHSRGGLINMLYAIQYPKIVNNLISLGTPYEGSDWASTYVDLQKMINPDANAYDDMLDPNHPYTYANNFYQIKDEVNSLAIGFKQTYPYFSSSLYSVLNDEKLEEIMQTIYYLSNGVLGYDCLEDFTYALTNAIINFTTNPIALNTLSFAYSILYAHAILTNHPGLNNLKTILGDITTLLNTDIQEQNGSYYLNSDICVNLDSQLGYYRGTTNPHYLFSSREIIVLGDSNNNYYYDEAHCSDPDNYWIAHNFETKSPTAINKIIDFLNDHNGFHEHHFVMHSNPSEHHLFCACGARTAPESHSYICTSLNATTHQKTCTLCSYSFTEAHSLIYKHFVNSPSHRETCTQCGYQDVVEHYFTEAIYVSSSYHLRQCPCGESGDLEAHNYHIITGNCICGDNNHAGHPWPPIP